MKTSVIVDIGSTTTSNDHKQDDEYVTSVSSRRHGSMTAGNGHNHDDEFNALIRI